MARPKKSKADARIFPVSFRCTEAEINRLADRAKQANQSVPLYARHACLTSQIRVVQEQALNFEARQELRDIGNNLNQIARQLNSGRNYSDPLLQNSLDRLNAFFDEALPK